MDHDLVAGLPAGDALADLPDDPGGVGAADVVVLVGVVAEHRHGLAERRPDVVEVHAGRHHADDHLERAGLGHLDLLELEGVDRLALALLADDPRGHRRAEARPARSRRVATWLRSTATATPSWSRVDCVPDGSYPRRAGRGVAGRSLPTAPSVRASASRLGRGGLVGLGGRGCGAWRPIGSISTQAAIGAAERRPRRRSQGRCRAPTRTPRGRRRRPAPSACSDAAVAERVGDRRACRGGTWGRHGVDLRAPDRRDERAHHRDAEGAADHPAHRQHTRGGAGLGPVDGVHRGGAHRRHHEPHAESHQHEPGQQQQVAGVDGDAATG